MAGHKGTKYRTMQNLEIIKSDLENNLIYLKGSVPGAKNSFVIIKKTSKIVTRSTTAEKISKVTTTTTSKTKTAKKETKTEEKKPT